MNMKSPLSNLCDVLNQVKRSATQYTETLRTNEAATRAVLIDPVLRAVGWDTANIDMVEVEKWFEKTVVDYALSDSNRRVKVIVEAKSMGSDLSSWDIRRKLIDYVYTHKLQKPDIFLTDGLIWHHFTDFQTDNVAPTEIINLAEGNVVDCAAYFVDRLDVAKFWSEPEDALIQQVARLKSDVLTLRQEVATLATSLSALSKAVVIEGTGEQLSPASINVQVPLFVELDNMPSLTNKRPASLRLPDGAQVPVRRWKDILREACKFVMATNPSISIPFPDRSDRKVNLLARVKPQRGSYDEEQYGGQPIYIYTNYDARNCIANAAYVLSQIPVDKRKIKAGIAFQSDL